MLALATLTLVLSALIGLALLQLPIRTPHDLAAMLRPDATELS